MRRETSGGTATKFSRTERCPTDDANDRLQGERPATPDQLLANLQAELKSTLTAKAAVGSKFLETNGINATEILSLHHRQCEMEHKEGATSQEFEQLKTHVKAFIESMPFERRKSRPGGPPNNIIEAIEASGVGLRANEILHLGVGVLPDSAKVAHESAKYPEWVDSEGEPENEKD
jgi:hypothetical protein